MGGSQDGTGNSIYYHGVLVANGQYANGQSPSASRTATGGG